VLSHSTIVTQGICAVTIVRRGLAVRPSLRWRVRHLTPGCGARLREVGLGGASRQGWYLVAPPLRPYCPTWRPRTFAHLSRRFWGPSTLPCAIRACSGEAGGRNTRAAPTHVDQADAEEPRTLRRLVAGPFVAWHRSLVVGRIASGQVFAEPPREPVREGWLTGGGDVERCRCRQRRGAGWPWCSLFLPRGAGVASSRYGYHRDDCTSIACGPASGVELPGPGRAHAPARELLRGAFGRGSLVGFDSPAVASGGLRVDVLTVVRSAAVPGHRGSQRSRPQ